MLCALLFLFLLSTKSHAVNGQAITFGEEAEEDNTTPSTEEDSVLTRLGGGNGLLASQLGVDPLGSGQQGRVPVPPNSNSGQFGNFQNGPACCCASGNFCPDPRNANQEAGFGGLIKPRGKDSEDDAIDPLDINTRIVNNPPNDDLVANNKGSQCPTGTQQCCYATPNDMNTLGSSCIPLVQFGLDAQVAWRQGCRENLSVNGGLKQCGQRSFKPLFNLKSGQASPEEFPWACLMLTDKNRFLGSCVIVPQTNSNDIVSGTRKVITAAHKLNSLKRDEGLKVRIIEYDASDFTNAEKQKHQEFVVTSFIKHPNFNPDRLSNDIAVLLVDKPIDLLNNNGVNAACFPACANMFDFKFNNGTGVRCWVAGWGKDAEKGQFSFIQRKVDVPIYDRKRCEDRLKQELSRDDPSIGRRFSLHPGEICAGGEAGKDACDGDGGSALVCQSDSGHWHVVGLVAWGVGCANPDVPGVYVNVHHYMDFINGAHSNNIRG